MSREEGDRYTACDMKGQRVVNIEGHTVNTSCTHMDTHACMHTDDHRHTCRQSVRNMLHLQFFQHRVRTHTEKTKAHSHTQTHTVFFFSLPEALFLGCHLEGYLAKANSLGFSLFFSPRRALQDSVKIGRASCRERV